MFSRLHITTRLVGLRDRTTEVVFMEPFEERDQVEMILD